MAECAFANGADQKQLGLGSDAGQIWRHSAPSLRREGGNQPMFRKTAGDFPPRDDPRRRPCARAEHK
jgi:hypothetical protein